MEPSILAYLDAWELSSPVSITTKRTSWVYLVESLTGPAVLKILNASGVADEQRGAIALEYFSGSGAANLLRFDQGAYLLEYIGTENLASLVRAGRDNEATEAAAGVLGKLHHERTGTPPTELWTLERWFRSLFLRSEQTGCPKNFKEAASIVKELLASPVREVVLHGDIHHENILLSPTRGWVAIDPKGLWGEATFDTANLFYNPLEMELRRDLRRIETMARILSEGLDLEYDRILRFAFAYGFLSASWMIEESQDASQTIEIANNIRQLF
jgi:streptomycin 6-kinase